MKMHGEYKKDYEPHGESLVWRSSPHSVERFASVQSAESLHA